jgi:hypothetical protein
MDEKVEKKPPRRTLLVIITIVSLLGALVVILLSYPRGSARGEIHSTGLPHGDFVVRPITCFSGGHWGFTGVWVVTETLTSGDKSGFKGGLKILKNDAGAWEAVVENPSICQGFKCQQLKVDARHCGVFDVVVKDRNLWFRYDGHAHLDCAFPEGGTLKADLSFEGCGMVPSSGDADL